MHLIDKILVPIFHFRKGGQYITGWFLKLCYGSSWLREQHVDDIKLNSITVPVTVIDENTNETKIYSMIGGFHGVESCDGRHKPVMSLAFVEQTLEKEQKSTNSSITKPKRKTSSDDDSAGSSKKIFKDQ